MQLLLKLKPWLLFSSFFIFPLLAAYIPIISPVMQDVWPAIWFAWIYVIGVSLHKLIPDSSRKKPSITYFKLTTAIVTIALLSFDIFRNYDAITLHRILSTLDKLWLVVLIQIYLILSILYMITFSSRMLESVIVGKVVGLRKSLKIFFSILVFPVGVWYVQPAIQRVLDRHNI